jgi:hypothetical protein
MAATSETDFVLARYTSGSELPFEFQIAYPQSTRPQPQSAAASLDGVFARLVEYRGPADCPLCLNVAVTVLPREIGVGDLAEVDAQRRGHQVLQRRDLSGKYAGNAEVLSACLEHDRPWLTRNRLVKHGRLAFRITAAAPYDRFPEIGVVAARFLGSFRLQGAPLEDGAERQETCVLPSPASASFAYPASWRQSEPLRTNDSVAVTLSNGQAGENAATITVEARVGAWPALRAPCLRRFTESLESQGIQCQGSLVVPMAGPAGFDTVEVFAPRANREGRAMAVGLVFFIRDNGVVTAATAGPSRDTSIQWWAINKRAFEIVRDSLVVGSPQASAPSANKYCHSALHSPSFL